MSVYGDLGVSAVTALISAIPVHSFEVAPRPAPSAMCPVRLGSGAAGNTDSVTDVSLQPFTESSA
jgi:hypothetical protein